MDKNKNKNSLMISIHFWMMFVSTIVFFITANWLKWMMMEVFSILFITLMNKTQESKIASMLYFLVSATAGGIMFFNVLLFMAHHTPGNNNDMFTHITQFTLAYKLALFPLNMWMITAYQHMNWWNIFLFSTINKIIPIYILTTMTELNNMFLLMIIVNSIMSAMLALLQTSMKKIMAYSSMNHLSYLIIMSFMNTKMFIFYFMFYSINTLLLINLIKAFNLKNKKMVFLFSNFPKFKYLYIMHIFSYAMLPPTTFFMIKWMFFYEMILPKNSTMNMFLFIMIISSILMTWTYLNLSNYQLLGFKLEPKNKIKFNSYMNKHYGYFLIGFIFNLMFFIILFH